MNIKRKELACAGGKITVEEFHDGYRMHVSIIAERLPAPCADEYAQAYQEAGIPIKAERKEIRFSVPDHIVMGLVASGQLGADTDIISALQLLGCAAWAHKDEPSPVFGYSTYTWAPHMGSSSVYGFDFAQGPLGESWE